MNLEKMGSKKNQNVVGIEMNPVVTAKFSKDKSWLREDNPGEVPEEVPKIEKEFTDGIADVISENTGQEMVRVTGSEVLDRFSEQFQNKPVICLASDLYDANEIKQKGALEVYDLPISRGRHDEHVVSYIGPKYLEDMLDDISKKIKQKTGQENPKVVLAEDTVGSGGTLIKIIQDLAERGVEVESIVTATLGGSTNHESTEMIISGVPVSSIIARNKEKGIGSIMFETKDATLFPGSGFSFMQGQMEHAKELEEVVNYLINLDKSEIDPKNIGRISNKLREIGLIANGKILRERLNNGLKEKGKIEVKDVFSLFRRQQDENFIENPPLVLDKQRIRFDPDLISEIRLPYTFPFSPFPEDNSYGKLQALKYKSESQKRLDLHADLFAGYQDLMQIKLYPHDIPSLNNPEIKKIIQKNPGSGDLPDAILAIRKYVDEDL